MVRDSGLRLLNRTLTWGLFMGWITAGRAAEGDPTPGTAAAQAAELYAEATRLYAAGAWSEGIERLETAYALYPRTGLLFNIAYGLEQLDGRCADVLATYGRYFDACRTTTCAELSVAQEKERRTRATCPGRLEITTRPTGGRVLVDGTPWGNAPTKRPVPSGDHHLKIELEGYVTAERVVGVEPDRAQAVEVLLVPLSAPTPQSRQGSDGLRDPAVPLQTMASPDYTWSYVAAGVGGLGLITGTVFALLTTSAVEDRDTANAAFMAGRSNDRARIESLDAAARRDQGIAIAGFGLAAAGIVTAAVLFFQDADTTGTTGLIRLGADSQGFVIEWGE